MAKAWKMAKESSAVSQEANPSQVVQPDANDSVSHDDRDDPSESSSSEEDDEN